MTTVVDLRWSEPFGRATLAPVTGHAEIAAGDTSAASAIACLDALLIDGGADSPGSGQADRLAVADRDRLLAVVFGELYEPRIDTPVTCSACSKLFDLEFLLSEVVAHCDPELDPEDRQNWSVNGISFRAPTGVDELTATRSDKADPASAIVARIIDVDGWTADDSTRAAIADRLEKLAPMVSTSIGAVCPECGESQAIAFDLQNYLLRRVAIDRPALHRQIHLLATTYHWSRADILSLTRRERLTYVDLIEADRRPTRSRVR